MNLLPVKRQLVRLSRFIGSKARLARPRKDAIAELTQRMLSGGFAQRAYADLCALAEQAKDQTSRQGAAWELALWHANQDTGSDAAECLRWLSAAAPRSTPDRGRAQQTAILRAECLERIGKTEEARKVLESALEDGVTCDLLLGYANLFSGEQKLHVINRAFTHCGLAKVESMLDGSPLSLGSLRPAAEMPGKESVSSQEPLVSVIVPAFNCRETVGIALESLLAQTWRNLEILVVDDGSADATAEWVAHFEERDARVRLIRSGKNQGPYVARNLALQTARGAYVTCHDSDDWSHPEKIARQVAHLSENPECIANLSERVRTGPDLRFLRRGLPGRYLHANLASLMFRREPVLSRIGYWDSVRFGGDIEFIKRLKKAFGETKVARVKPGPVELARESEASLTGNARFGYPGYLMGARKEYAEASAAFLESGQSLKIEFPQSRRSFPVPEPLWPDREPRADGKRHFDVILASDFRLRGGSTISNAQEIRAQKAAGLRTGLLQMDVYEYPQRSVSAIVRKEIDGELVQMLVYGEEVECDLLILRFPLVLLEHQNFLPNVKAREIRVVVNQPPVRDYKDGNRAYDLGQCQDQLVRHFGKKGLWSPIGPLVRETLLQEEHVGSLIDLSGDDWLNIIDVAEWDTGAARCTGPLPVIGRHSRDKYLKWPEKREDLLNCYPGDNRFLVKVLGGAGTASRVLGRIPPNWKVFPFDSISPVQFLAEIDVFVYFHHSGWVEAFGRAPLEAMAAGLPVILPGHFRPLFQEAALYAEPREVRDIVWELHRNQAWYQERSRISRRFVEENFGYSLHLRRIAPYVKALQQVALPS